MLCKKELLALVNAWLVIALTQKQALASHELILLRLTPSGQLCETVICFVLF